MHREDRVLFGCQMGLRIHFTSSRMASNESIVNCCLTPLACFRCGWHGGLMVSALSSGESCLGLNPSHGHCVVLLRKTL